MIQSNWVRSPSCKPQIHSHAGVMRFMPCQRASLRCREQPLVGYDEGVPFPRWYSVSPIQSGEGGGRSAHLWRSFTGKTTTREPRSALQQLLRPGSRETLDAQHLGSHREKYKFIRVDVIYFCFKRSSGTTSCLSHRRTVCVSPFMGSDCWISLRFTELKVCLFKVCESCSVNGVNTDYHSLWEIFDTIPVLLAWKQWMAQLWVLSKIYKNEWLWNFTREKESCLVNG